MKLRSRWLAGLAAVALVLVTSATAFGYAGEVAAAVTIASPGGTLECDVDITVTATIVDATGALISGHSVDWSFESSPSSLDTINETPTTTDASGVATTTVVLACVAGDREIRAGADNISASAVLGVTAAGLPNTSTLPVQAPASQDLSLVGTLLAVLAMAAGGALTFRRISLRRG